MPAQIQLFAFGDMRPNPNTQIVCTFVLSAKPEAGIITGIGSVGQGESPDIVIASHAEPNWQTLGPRLICWFYASEITGHAANLLNQAQSASGAGQ